MSGNRQGHGIGERNAIAGGNRRGKGAKQAVTLHCGDDGAYYVFAKQTHADGRVTGRVGVAGLAVQHFLSFVHDGGKSIDNKLAVLQCQIKREHLHGHDMARAPTRPQLPCSTVFGSVQPGAFRQRCSETATFF